MSREEAKAFYDRGLTDPVKGYVTPEDAQDAIDVIYNDVAAGDAANLSPANILPGENVVVDAVTSPGDVIINAQRVVAGGMVQSEWVWLASPQTGNLQSGRAGVDTDLVAESTVLYISRLDVPDVDWSYHLGQLDVGWHVYGQQIDDASSWHRWAVTGPGTLVGDTWEIPVETESGSPQGTEPSNNKHVIFGFEAPTVFPPIPFLVAASDAAEKTKDEADYVCDGVDDQAEINAALAACVTGGGKVVLSEGNFNLSSSILVETEAVTLQGSGTGQRNGATQQGFGTRINVTAGLTGAAILVQAAANVRPLYGVTLRDFTIDGWLLGTEVDGVHMRSNRSHIDHVHVHRVTGHGIRLHGYQSPHWDTYDSVVTFCQMGDNTLSGMFFDEDSADCHLVSTIMYNNGDNVIIGAASQQITSCHMYNGDRYNIFFNGSGSRTKILNCKIEGSGSHAINIDSTNGGYSDIQITGNGFSTNGDAADNTADHIIIQGPSNQGVSRTVIVGNSFGHKASVSPNRARYGIHLASSTAQRTVIIGNSFGPSDQFPFSTSQFGTAPIYNNGSRNVPALIQANAGAFDDPAPAFVNVTHAPYGARGNGAEDDTAAIQAALDSLPETGGVVYLPEGSYEISSPLIIRTDNTMLMGAGLGNRISGSQKGRGSRIEVDAAFVGSAAVLVQRDLDDRTVFGVKLVDLAIDGDSNGTNVDGVLFKSTNGQIDNVAVNSTTGHGIRVVGYSGWTAKQNRITNCVTAYNAAGAGVFLEDYCENTVVTGCISHDNLDGVLITETDLQFSNCVFHTNTRYGMYFNNAGSRSAVNGCKFLTNGQHGLIFDSSTAGFSNISVSGCVFDSNGTAANNTYDHVILTGLTSNGISRIALTGNVFAYASGSSPNKPRYAVNLTNGASQNAVVETNAFGPASHWGTAAVNNSGSSGSPCLVRHNSGWLTESNGSATVAPSTTSITVNHGLSTTPSLNDIQVTPTNSMNGANKFWISNPTATTFDIVVDQTPGASSTAQFVWKATVV